MVRYTEHTRHTHTVYACTHFKKRKCNKLSKYKLATKFIYFLFYFSVRSFSVLAYEHYSSDPGVPLLLGRRKWLLEKVVVVFHPSISLFQSISSMNRFIVQLVEMRLYGRGCFHSNHSHSSFLSRVTTSQGKHFINPRGQSLL